MKSVNETNSLVSNHFAQRRHLTLNNMSRKQYNSASHHMTRFGMQTQISPLSLFFLIHFLKYQLDQSRKAVDSLVTVLKWGDIIPQSRPSMVAFGELTAHSVQFILNLIWSSPLIMRGKRSWQALSIPNEKQGLISNFSGQ